jgi:hypothetical protein
LRFTAVGWAREIPILDGRVALPSSLVRQSICGVDREGGGQAVGREREARRERIRAETVRKGSETRGAAPRLRDRWRSASGRRGFGGARIAKSGIQARAR